MNKNLLKNPYFKTVVVVIILLMFIPGVMLLKSFINLEQKDYSLEISNNELLVKYVYEEDLTPEKHFSNLESGQQEAAALVKSKKVFLQEYDTRIDELNEEYALVEDGFEPSSNSNLYISGQRDQAADSFSADNDGPLTLGLDNVSVVSSLEKMEVIQDFADVGAETNNKIVFEFDEEAKAFDNPETLKTYIDESLIKTYDRPVNEFSLSSVNKFYTSPPPTKDKINSIKDLNSIKLILDRPEYYRFEIIRLNLVTDRNLDINDLKVYITRDKYLIPNVGGRHDIFFKYKVNTIYTTLALGYNPSPGNYKVLVKSLSNPNWEGVQKSFKLIRRIPPKIEKGFSVVNWEYGPSVRNFKFKGLDGKMGNYEKVLQWVNYMEANALWVLAGQTTGWDKKVSPETPWGSRQTEKSMDLFAKVSSKYNIGVGAYVMSFYTPKNGKVDAGYAPSLGYDSSSQKLQDSLHISLKDEKRINDIVGLASSFQKNPNVKFIGLDFIRTGRADGYEMGPQVVEDMNIPTPRGYENLSTIKKIKWFASKVENQQNRNIIIKWRWWRAHRVATIANIVIRKAKLTKPLWVFTLGWEHGKQHGQDPYMFFDAGVFADSVMLYEANRIQFRTMMIQWPNYMRDDLNNVIIGNAVDIRFLDNEIGSYGAEYIYRSKKAYRNIYKYSKAKGLFMHDMSRAFWSSKRGYDISEWAILHGHSTSAFREEQGLIPYKASILFNKDMQTGKIVVENTSDGFLDNLKVVYSKTPSWIKISDNIPKSFSLAAKSRIEFKFVAQINPDKVTSDNILGYYVDHPAYPKYFFLTFRNSDKQLAFLERAK